MDRLLFLKYNNYYNKTVKKEEYLAGYLTNSEANEWVHLKNFLPGDGLYTTSIINWNKDWLPDYVVRYSDDATATAPSILDNMTSISVYGGIDTELATVYLDDIDTRFVSDVSKRVNTKGWSDYLYNTTGLAINRIVFDGVGYAVDFSMEFSDIKPNTNIRFKLRDGTYKMYTFGERGKFKLDYEYLHHWWRFEPQDYIEELTIWANGDITELTLSDMYTFIDYNNKATPVDRWFVTRSTRTRQGQYEFELVRDVVVDYYNSVVSAPCYVERATVNETDNLIFNTEGFTFNQIKKSEINLEDETKTPWIVGYLPSNLDNKTGKFNLQKKAMIPITNEYDELIPSSNWVYADGIKVLSKINKWQFNLNSYYISGFLGWWENWDRATLGCEYIGGAPKDFSSDISHEQQAQANSYYKWNGIVVNSLEQWQEIVDTPRTNWFNVNNLETALVNSVGNLASEAYFKDLQSYDGKLLEFSDGVYRVRLGTVREQTANTELLTNGSDNNELSRMLYSTIEAKVKEIDNKAYYFEENDALLNANVFYTYKYLPVALERVDDIEDGITWSIPTTSRKLIDNPYKMFAIPLYGITAEFTDTENTLIDISTTAQTNLELAMSISRELVSNQEIYDLQILPYCPISGLYRDEEGILKMPTDLVSLYDYTYVFANEEAVSFILFPRQSSFTKTITDVPISVDDIKVSNECDVYRLCSPNYASVYEFSPAKNRGVLAWNIYCTYKPFSPYIQVAPSFNALYGEDFNDFRGLICSGDFSLPLVDDAWTTYELNNKNYQNSFDRQIENLDVIRKYDKIGDVLKAITGTISGTASGAFTGQMIGGAKGAAVGAAVGAASTAAAGIADVLLNDKKYEESRDYLKDQFEFQLQNVQALPTTLSKVSSLTANYKFYPFIEYYTCTDEEKELFRNYLKYKGMTVNNISTISNYLQPDYSYVQGKIIKQEYTDMDYHELLECNRRISEGVYIK